MTSGSSRDRVIRFKIYYSVHKKKGGARWRDDNIPDSVQSRDLKKMEKSGKGL